METIDLSAEVEQPKAKAKPRAKAKAAAEPVEPIEVPKAKAKAKPRAKPKAKAAAEAPLVDAVAEIEPPVKPPEEPPAEPPVEEAKPPTEPEVVEVATTTRKPKGHRPKIENKEKLTKKVNCKKCDKTVSLHSIKYTHEKFCPAPPEEEPQRPPLTLREKMQQQRQATAQRLIAQCFNS